MFHRCRQHGLTLLELLIAMSIMVMVMGTLGVVARGIQQGYEYAEGHGEATQHARVALERIARAVSGATANEQFPGLLVVAHEEGAWRFPETLVVWHPSGAAADPEGLPRFEELVIFCPDWDTPKRLVELTLPGDTRTVPAADDEAGWRGQIEAIRQASAGEGVTLSDLLRTCPTAAAPGDGSLRGAVRFESRLRPSRDDWQAYRDGDALWEDLPWVQGIYGSNTGLRQAWVRYELQLMPGDELAAEDRDAYRAVCFFGSAALYYEMHR